MKRPILLLALSGLLTTFTACDYNNTPGKDPQASQDFTQAPKARATETNLDSISGGDEAYEPIGKGSAADQKTSADAGLQSSPSNPTSPTSTMPQNNTETKSTVREE
ncbi:hypothetical protein SAMN06265337_2433 [Hymenobacter gelipurpurascens]|uniref:Uncharacterized protein n=1 Tax=Hymenobacter gelipurpurascens TaxID=89968 RepID=A0A212U933_9BACT|nr:hypothetical protein [Hymenobacter gelipurpurascens]SNC74564.1 hypothetical protein SAMN06265337_2433 [Hymenobacter gelipurpurascens]